MLNAILLVIQIGVIFFLSRRVYRILVRVFHKIFRNEKVTSYFLSIIYLPGTFIHEISHFLMSLILLVPVGRINLVPEIEESRLKLGSTEIARTDPFRRFFVGVAPIIFGTFFLIMIIYMSVNTEFFNTTLKEIIVIYLTFTVSNTMFLSKKDLEGAWIILLILTVLIVLAQIVGISLNLELDSNGIFRNTLKDANWYLLVPIVINVVVLAVFGIFK